MRRRSHRHDNRLRKRRSSRADDRQARRSQRRHLGPSIGTFGPVALTGEDHGCVTDDPGDPNQPWANTTENRSYVVSPAQDRSGYFVTRYDLNGAFTAILDRQHPGCTDSGTFTKATKGTWNGVWTQKVTGAFDYNPDAAMPADPSWDSFLNAVFGVSLADAAFVSYEVDYYDSCHDHWRDANYSGTSQQSGDDRGLLAEYESRGARRSRRAPRFT